MAAFGWPTSRATSAARRAMAVSPSILGGDRWDGTGLDVQTSNGGVKLSIPDPYNAELTTRTVNGGFRSDVAMTVQGELSPRRGISATIGAAARRSACARPTARSASIGASAASGRRPGNPRGRSV